MCRRRQDESPYGERVDAMMRQTGRMQHLLGVTSLWVLLPAVLHVMRAPSFLEVALVLVSLQCTVCTASVLYWRHYNPSSLVGSVDTAGSVLAMPALALRCNKWREMGALLSAIVFFYRLSVHLRKKRKPAGGLAAHATFRFCAFWLSTCSLLGDGDLLQVFRHKNVPWRVLALTLLYAAQCLYEFLLGASYCDKIKPPKHTKKTFRSEGLDDLNTPLLPWRLYGKGLLRSALIVVTATKLFLPS